MRAHLMTVFRIESEGEEPIPYPSLQDAMREAPSHPESKIATSLYGVVLAETSRGAWVLTYAGRDVIATLGWKVAS